MLRNLVKNLLELIHKFSRFAGYKNIKKSIVFLYSSNEKTKYEIKKVIPFTKVSERTKYIGINLTREVKKQSETSKTLLK